MSNYEYIIASLPYLTVDYHYADGQGFQDIVAEIRENLSEADIPKDDAIIRSLFEECRISKLSAMEKVTYRKSLFAEYRHHHSPRLHSSRKPQENSVSPLVRP